MSAAEILHRFIVVPLLCQASHVTNARELVGDLKERLEYLMYRYHDIVSAVEAEEVVAGRRRTGQVERWLREVKDIETQVIKFQERFESQRCGFSGNICSTFKIATKVSKMLGEVKDLDEKGRHIGDLTRELRPPPGQEIPATSYFQIMESNLEKVQGHLAAGETTIGLLGMGGVGKTTLLAAIKGKFCATDSSCDICFERVVWVVVSRDASTRRLQEEIAKGLQLPLMDDAQSRRDAILDCLRKKKAFLLLLDDVRELLDLDAIGIPERGRTLIFTTRSEDVCRRMEARTIVKVERLDEDAAWRLFKRAVGDEVIMRNPDNERLAKKVAHECLGLPLALIVVSRTMSAKRSSTILEGVSSCTRTRGEWVLALDSLKKSGRSPLGQEYVTLSILKHGYDSLEDDISRQCFLCCALFPEHYAIPEDDLIECFSGHGLIDPWDFNDIGAAYDYGRRIVKALLSSCLLETSEEGGERMHDVVRDMALWIARDCGKNDIKWVVRAGLESVEPLKGVDGWEMADRVSLMYNEVVDLPDPRMRCQNLSTLMLGHNHALKTIPPKFFLYFPALTYLDLSSTSIASIPEEVSMLGELQYLNLARTNVTCVSKELGALKKLEHLILRDCKRLSYVPYGLISQFEKLRVLDLYGCPFIFTTADIILQNAEITADMPLENAETIPDSEKVNNGGDDDAPQSIQGSSEGETKANIEELKKLKGRVRGLGLNLDVGTISDLQSIFDNASVLKLKLLGLEESNVLDIVELLSKIGKNMDHLNFEKLPRVEELIFSSGNQKLCFDRLKSFSISELNRLTTIIWYRGSLLQVFPDLTSVNIDSCRGLRDLTWIGHLPCLKYLWVHECHRLKEIISDESGVVALPRLKEIHLESLPKLDHICYGRISCPLLTSVCVLQCPMVGEIPFESEGEQSLNINWDTTESTTSVTCNHKWHSGV